MHCTIDCFSFTLFSVGVVEEAAELYQGNWPGIIMLKSSSFGGRGSSFGGCGSSFGGRGSSFRGC